MNKRRKISIIAPFYNEENVVDFFIERSFMLKIFALSELQNFLNRSYGVWRDEKPKLFIEFKNNVAIDVAESVSSSCR